MDLSSCSFTKGEEIGKGGYGSVYSVYDHQGIEYAAKYQSIINTYQSSGLSTAILSEIDALVRLKNVPGVIKLIGVCYQNNEIAIILEKMDTDLYSYIKSTPVEQRLPYLSNFFEIMIKSVALFESLNINHFDIKSENILIKIENTVPIFKITDFGLARNTFSELQLAETFFTSWYRPPELLADRDRSTFPSFSGDIWALALTILEFITGTPVVFGDNEAKIMDRINYLAETNLSLDDFYLRNKNGSIYGEINVITLLNRRIPDHIKLIPNNIIQLLSLMLKLNPAERITANQILITLGQPITPEYLAQFIPSEYPRQIKDKGIRIIVDLIQEQGYGKIPTLIAIEIYTRFLNISSTKPSPISFTPSPKLSASPKLSPSPKLSASPKSSGSQKSSITSTMFNFRNLPVDTFALAATQIAARLFYKVTTSALIDRYQRIINYPQQISVIQVGLAEKDILNLIGFSVYNLNLGPVIDRAYDEYVNLRLVNPARFAEPLKRWLTIKDVDETTDEIKTLSLKLENTNLTNQDKFNTEQRIFILQKALNLTPFDTIKQKLIAKEIKHYEIKPALQNLTFPPNVIMLFIDNNDESYLTALYYDLSNREVYPPQLN